MPIVIKRADGGVSIMELLQGKDVPKEIKKFKQSSPDIDIVSWREFNDEEMPTDRTFREAWSDTTPEFKIDYDMDKCRKIWRDKMRSARAPKLAALDIESVRATEDGKPTADIIAAKKILRDVTKIPEIDAAKTPEELKAVWPEVLA